MSRPFVVSKESFFLWQVQSTTACLVDAVAIVDVVYSNSPGYVIYCVQDTVLSHPQPVSKTFLPDQFANSFRARLLSQQEQLAVYAKQYLVRKLQQLSFSGRLQDKLIAQSLPVTLSC